MSVVGSSTEEDWDQPLMGFPLGFESTTPKEEHSGASPSEGCTEHLSESGGRANVQKGLEARFQRVRLARNQQGYI